MQLKPWVDKRLRTGALVVFVSMLAGCTQPAEPVATQTAEMASTSETPTLPGETVEIGDNEGTKTVPLKPEKVVTFDEGTKDLLAALGVEADYAESPEEAARFTPELVVVGAEGAFSLAHIEEAVEDAALIDISPRPEPPLDWEVVRQVQILGQVFDKEDKAAQLDHDFSEALKRARDKAKKSWTVAALEAHDGQIDALPKNGGDLWGSLITMVELKPVEMQEDPDVLLVEELDPDMRAEGYVPSLKLLLEDERLKNTPAVKDMNIYVSPFDAPPAGSLTSYTAMLNELAELWASID